MRAYRNTPLGDRAQAAERVAVRDDARATLGSRSMRRSLARASIARALTLSVLSAAAFACSTKDPDSRLIDQLSGNQCVKQMRAIDERVAEMEDMLRGQAKVVVVIDQVERIRQDIPAAQTKCTANDAAMKKLRKLDRDLEALEERLAIDSYK